MLIAQLAARPERSRTSRPGRDGAARQRRCTAPSGADDATRVRVPHGARRHALAGRDRVGAATSRSRPTCRSTRCRSRSGSRAACASGCKTTAGLQVRADRRSTACCFYLTGRDDVANKLYELCLASGARRRSSCPPADAAPWHELLPPAVGPAGRLRRRRGAAAGHAAVVPGLPAAAGVLLVPAALPVLRADGLAPRRSAASTANEVELVLLFGRGEPTLESVVDASNLALFCTPAINLFAQARRPHPRQRQRATSTTSSPTGRGRWISRSTRSPSVVGHGVGRRQRAASSCRSTRRTQRPTTASASRRTSRRGASRGCCPADAEAARAALELHRHRGVPVARRPGAGAVQRRPAPAVGPDAVHQPRPARCRCRWASGTTRPRRSTSPRR